MEGTAAMTASIIETKISDSPLGNAARPRSGKTNRALAARRGFATNGISYVRLRRLTAAVAVSALAFLNPTTNVVAAEACASIDFWLETIREGGGRHSLFSGSDVSRFVEGLGKLIDVPRLPWTSVIAASFPDGRGLVLLNSGTSVCGILEVGTVGAGG